VFGDLSSATRKGNGVSPLMKLGARAMDEKV